MKRIDTLTVADNGGTLTRASEAMYCDKDGVWHTAAIDEARWHYDPGTGIFAGQLVEEASVNMITHSWDLRNTVEAGATRVWGQFNDADTGCALVARDNRLGGSQVAKLFCTSSGTIQRQTSFNSTTMAPDNTVCVSWFIVEPGEVRYCRLYTKQKNDLYPGVVFDMLTGAVVIVSSTPVVEDYGIVNAGNGCWLIWNAADVLTKTGATTGTAGTTLQIVNSLGSNYTAGDGTIPATTGEVWTMQGTAKAFTDLVTSTSYVTVDDAGGCQIKADDSAAFDITGDIDIDVQLSLVDWTPATVANVLTKWVASGNQRSYLLRINTDGSLGIYWTTDGTVGTQVLAVSTVVSGIANGTVKYIRVTIDVDNGAAGRDIKFFTSNDGAAWTQLGATVTQAGTTSIFAGTAYVNLNGFQGTAATGLAGNIYKARIYNGIRESGGTLVSSFDASRARGLGDGFYIHHAQYEIGVTKPSSPIITNGATGARAADIRTAMMLCNVPEDDYPVWTSGAVFDIGDRCMVTDAAWHNIYASKIDTNSGNDPTTEVDPVDAPVNWVLVSKTNRWKPFDLYSSSQAVLADRLLYSIQAPADAMVDSFGLMNIEGTEATVVVTHPTEGVVFSEQFDLVSGSGIVDYWEYFNLPASLMKNLVDTGLDVHAGVQLDVEIVNLDATAKAGAIAFGLSYDYGETQYGMDLSFTDYSAKRFTEYGDVILTERSYSDDMSLEAWLPNEFLAVVKQDITRVRAKPNIWIGSDAYGEASSMLGWVESARQVVAYYKVTVLSIKLKGLS